MSTTTPPAPAVPEELVVLLDADHRPCGTAAKAVVHTGDTPLHLAFSCWVSRPDGRVLVTRRATTKRTWPGVWTNTVCGHPGPGEDPADAVVRRAREELGLVLRDVALVLPDFAYRAVDASGVVEHEVCPVFTATTDADPVPAPGEVAEWRWAAFDDVAATAARTPWALSPWSVLQAAQLAALR